MTSKTQVVFRKFTSGIAKGEIIALFPNEPWADPKDTHYVASYMHVGQHSGAIYTHVIGMSKAATEKEYKPLYDELVRIGYDNLEIRKRK